MLVLDARTVRLSQPLAAVALLLTIGLAFGTGGRVARAHEGHGMPARVQQGTCEEVGPVAFELTGVGATEDVEGNALPEPQILGAPTAAEVQASVTTVPSPLDEILADGHAIVVYQSDDAMDVTVACGDVGGIVVGEDLIVGLEPGDEEGMSGVALLRAEAGQTVVSLFLMPAEHGHGDAEATPAA